MRILAILLFIPLVSFAKAQTDVLLEGTLFKKDNKWFLFVESDKASFKKGTLELTNVPKEQKKYLIDKAFVQISGTQDKCPTHGICLSVKTMKLTTFDPLKGREKIK